MEDRSIIELFFRRSERAIYELGRTILIAAIISVFFAVAAFALGYSIHQQRQQQLRELMQVEENNVTGYVEYPAETNTESLGEYTVTLLSSTVNDQFVELYFNLSPVDESYAEGMQIDGYNIYCSQGEGWRLCAPVLRDPSREYSDGQALTMEDYMYDDSTKTLTMQCSFAFNMMDAAESCTTTVRLWPGDKVLGSFTYSTVADLNSRTCLFSVPVEFSCPAAGINGQILGIVLQPTGAIWLVDCDEKEALYAHYTQSSLTDEQKQWVEQVQLPWLNALGDALEGTLHMADGTDFALYSGESSRLDGDIIKCYVFWELKTIDIDKAVSITVCGETIDLG